MTTALVSATNSRALIEVRDSSVHGSGVFALRPIKRGRRVIEYRGERISHAEAYERYQESITHTFLFTVDRRTVIDPQVKGNAARFINHSCDPNCESMQDEDRIYIMAIRDIAPGEELGYDYCLVPADTKDKPSLYACRCGAATCRGTLLAPKYARRKGAARKRAASPSRNGSANGHKAKGNGKPAAKRGRARA